MEILTLFPHFCRKSGKAQLVKFNLTNLTSRCLSVSACLRASFLFAFLKHSLKRRLFLNFKCVIILKVFIFFHNQQSHRQDFHLTCGSSCFEENYPKQTDSLISDSELGQTFEKFLKNKHSI